MNILVTGGAGYVGSHVVIELIELGHEVTVLDNLSSGHQWAVQQGQLIKGDIRDPEAIRNAIEYARAEAVIHLAALSDLRASLSNPVAFHQTNTVGTLNVASACMSQGIKKLIFSSSAAVYGIPTSLPVTEEARTVPVTPYGTSKAMGEQILSEISNASDVTVINLRYFNVAGADPRGRVGEAIPNSWHLVKVACEAALGLRREVSIYGTDYETPDGTCIRDYVHVADVASAHVAALDWPKSSGEFRNFNIGYGHGFSVREIISKVKDYSDVDFHVTETRRRTGEPPILIAAVDRIRDELAWESRFDSLEEIVASALDWERKYIECKRQGHDHSA